MLFKDIIGQEQTQLFLRKTVSDSRISHSILLIGKCGIGKLPLAFAYARYIHCENRNELDACGECSSCKKYNSFVHPDLHLIFPVVKEEKKKSVSDTYIEEWRNFIKENKYFTTNNWLEQLSPSKQGMIYAEESGEIIKKLSLKTYEGEYKVMIIYRADKMNAIASNKLLKILEEPTDKTIFILTAEEGQQILPTILSRCQVLKVPPIEENILFNRLTAISNKPVAEITNCLKIASGSFTEAMQCLEDQAENLEQLELFKVLMRCTYSKNLIDLLQLSEQLAKLSKERQKEFLAYCMHLVRGNYLLTINVKGINKFNKEEELFAEKFHKFINNSNVKGFIKEFEKAIFHLDRNGNAQIIFSDMGISFIKLFNLAKN